MEAKGQLWPSPSPSGGRVRTAGGTLSGEGSALGRKYPRSAPVSVVPGGAVTPTPGRRVRRRPPAAQTKDRAPGAPPLTAQIVGPLVQHPLHGAGRGPSLAALTAPGPRRRGARAAGPSPGAAEPPTPGARPAAGTPGRSHRRPGAGSLQRPRHVRAGQGPARLRSGAGTRVGRRGGRASQVPQARQRVAGGAGTARSRSPRPAGPRGPLAHAQCTTGAPVAKIHSWFWR